MDQHQNIQRQQQEQMRRQQEQMRQQQEQMKQQQEQMRRMQMGAAWTEQQKSKAAQQQAGQPLPTDPYTQLEGLVKYLRQEYAAKRVTKEQAEAQLRQSMIEDEQGTYWTVGFETGDWYRLTGGQWVKANPPHNVIGPAASLPEAMTERKPRNFLGFIAFLFGCAITFGLGVAVGGFVSNSLGIYGSTDVVLASIVWLVGFLLSVRWGRKVARGK